MLKELQGSRRCLDGAMEEWARVGRLFRLIVARYVVSAHTLLKPAMTVRVRGARAQKRALATAPRAEGEFGGCFRDSGPQIRASEPLGRTAVQCGCRYMPSDVDSRVACCRQLRPTCAGGV